MAKETLTERLTRTEKRLAKVLSWVSDIQGTASRYRRGTDGKKYLLNDLAIIEGQAQAALEEK